MNIENMNIKWWQNIWRFLQNMKHFERNMSLWQTCVGLGCMQQWPAHNLPFPCPLSRSFFYIFFSNSLFILNIFVNHIARLYHKTIDRSINFTIVSLYCISGWHVNSVTFDTGALFRVHEQRLASLFAVQLFRDGICRNIHTTWHRNTEMGFAQNINTI